MLLLDAICIIMPNPVKINKKMDKGRILENENAINPAPKSVDAIGMSFYTMALMGTAPFGSLLAGSLAQWIGAPHTLLIGGATCVIGAILFTKNLPKIKNQIHPIYVKQGIMTDPLDVLDNK